MMNIALLTPGAGDNFYCENCMRDAATLRALRGLGHEAMSVPLYLPPLDPETGQSSRNPGPIFFGGVNVFLQQKVGLFRHTPRWLDKLFDAGWLLRWAGRKTGMTNAKMLGEMTLSMLRGQHGRQRKELDRLCDFLADDPPEVLIFSNALLIGMARRLKDRTGAAAICWLQDEDHFLDSLPADYSRKAWDVLRERAGDIDQFLSPSRYYRDVMQRRLSLGDERITVLPQGIETDESAAGSAPAVPTVGFLSQMSASKGLDVLLEAVALLRNTPGLESIRLIADGGETQADRPFVETLQRRIAELGMTDAVELRQAFDRPGKRRFLREISVLAVPTRSPEAYGLYILEAMAAGAAVVVPDHGGQAELVRDTGGGMVYSPNDAAALAENLKALLLNSTLNSALAERGKDAVNRRYDVKDMAEKLIGICQN